MYSDISFHFIDRLKNWVFVWVYPHGNWFIFLITVCASVPQWSNAVNGATRCAEQTLQSTAESWFLFQNSNCYYVGHKLYMMTAIRPPEHVDRVSGSWWLWGRCWRAQNQSCTLQSQTCKTKTCVRASDDRDAVPFWARLWTTLWLQWIFFFCPGGGLRSGAARPPAFSVTQGKQTPVLLTLTTPEVHA